MNIAFDDTLPEKAKVAALIEASGLTGQWDAGRFFGEAQEEYRVISAYDRDRLVGIGRILEEGRSEDEGQSRFDIVVMPDYRHRDIVGTMFRLLNRRRRTPVKQA
ncbi:hypothetical protein ACFFNY_04485 [Paenibacillus hodogayensis]|uniref:GNAT family N-acetyltransferase n=1 Tax=Paenibacillus hodogayensis TaxID=279208 RepID=A0ABV5VRB9_9BACL